MARALSVQEISKHNIPDDLWLVVDDTVYDLTDFAPEHPGGASSMPIPFPPPPLPSTETFQ
jgi:L-lactate dehydrogenase (cytochrome)